MLVFSVLQYLDERPFWSWWKPRYNQPGDIWLFCGRSWPLPAASDRRYVGPFSPEISPQAQSVHRGKGKCRAADITLTRVILHTDTSEKLNRIQLHQGGAWQPWYTNISQEHHSSTCKTAVRWGALKPTFGIIPQVSCSYIQQITMTYWAQCRSITIMWHQPLPCGSRQSKDTANLACLVIPMLHNVWQEDRAIKTVVWSYLWRDDALHAALQVTLEDMGFG